MAACPLAPASSWRLRASGAGSTQPESDHKAPATKPHTMGLRSTPSTVWRTAWRKAEADKDLVKNQGDASFAADLTQVHQPLRVSLAIEVSTAAAVEQGGVAWRSTIGVQGLQRVDQHAGHIASGAQHLKAARAHFSQGVGLARRQWIARPRLNVFPPAVVGPREPHEVRPAGVVPGQSYRLHDGLRARHVKGDFLQARYTTERAHVVQHTRVVGPQHGPQRADHGRALVDAGLVKVVAQQVDAVRAGQIVKAIAVEVLHKDIAAGLQEAARAQVLTQVGAVLEGHAVLAGELQVRQVGTGLGGDLCRAGITALEVGTQSGEAGSPLGHDRCIGPVGGKEGVFVVGVTRNHRGHALGQPRVTGQRPVLGPRQFDPLLGLGKQPRQQAQSGGGHGEGLIHE